MRSNERMETERIEEETVVALKIAIVEFVFWALCALYFFYYSYSDSVGRTVKPVVVFFPLLSFSLHLFLYMLFDPMKDHRLKKIIGRSLSLNCLFILFAYGCILVSLKSGPSVFFGSH
jgi:hypothetical protein